MDDYTHPSCGGQALVEKKISELLSEARQQRGLTQTDLAARTGLQPSAISHFETGKRSPSFDNLRRLADALNVSIDQLLGRSTASEVVTPETDQLFRDVARMSTEDQDALAKMARILADRNT